MSVGKRVDGEVLVKTTDFRSPRICAAAWTTWNPIRQPLSPARWWLVAS